MGQRIIFLDIDGTLAEPGSNEAPASAIWAARQAQAQGHLVYLCTGRNYHMLKPFLKYGFDGVIASSGGYAECSGKAIYDCPMTKAQAQSAMEALGASGVFRTVECMDGSYTDEGLKEHLRAHALEGSNSELLRWREQIEESLNILPMKEYHGQPIYKIVIMCQSMEQLIKPRQVLEGEFHFCIQDPQEDGFVNGEIVNKKFNKGKALVRVCGYLGIPVSQSVAIGDSMNDLEMIEAAGVGICMGNGSSKLMQLADGICPSLQEDGIKEAFQKLGLI